MSCRRNASNTYERGVQSAGGDVSGDEDLCVGRGGDELLVERKSPLRALSCEGAHGVGAELTFEGISP